MNNKAQFTPGPCTCEIVMRTGETLDSSLGDRLCSDISRIQLCPKHSAAPAMYEALKLATWLTNKCDCHEAWNVPEGNLCGRCTAELAIKTALAQAEGKQS